MIVGSKKDPWSLQMQQSLWESGYLNDMTWTNVCSPMPLRFYMKLGMD